MELISDEEIERLKAECKLNKIKEIRETTIFDKNETIQTMEVIREKGNPTVTEIKLTPDDITISFNKKEERSEYNE